MAVVNYRVGGLIGGDNCQAGDDLNCAEQAKLSAQIAVAVKEARSLLERYDNRDLLSRVAFDNAFDDMDNFEEGLLSAGISRVEYAQSLALATGPASKAEDATGEEAKRFAGSIDRVFALVERYYSEERAAAPPDDLAADIRFTSMLTHMGIRGSSYEAHLFELLRGLFGPHESLLRAHYDIDVEMVISGIVGIVTQVNRNVFRYQTFVREKNAEIKAMYDRHFKQNAPRITDIRAFNEEWEALPEVLSKVREFNREERELRHRVFAVNPTDGVSEPFLELFSALPSSNEDFLSSEKAPGWPGNPTVVEKKPFLVHEGRYQCYAVQLFTSHAVDIMEALIREADARYFSKAYEKRRASYLEETSLRLLSELLPGAKVFGGLFYEAEEDGVRKRLETDGIMLYDNNVLIVEAKAGSLSVPARRGGLARIKNDAGKLIDQAYGQAARTKRYIAEEDVPRFEHKDGSTALVLEDKAALKNFYFVNVTLADLGPLSARLSSLRAFDLLEGKGWPWSVFVNDLRVISDITDSPSEFLLYLQGRIRANEHGKFRSLSELDFFMYFLREGLEFEHKYYDQFDFVVPNGYTDALDRYYEKLAGRLPEGEKPRLDVPARYRRLVSGLEDSGRPGFSDVTTTLLRLGHKTHDEILEWLDKVERLAAKDGRDHDLTLVFRQLDVGLTFLVRGRDATETLDDIAGRLRVAPRRNRVGTWMLISVDRRTKGDETYDFRAFGRDGGLPAVKAGGKPGGRVGRNEPCPCGSGLKFKKCCGKPAG